MARKRILAIIGALCACTASGLHAQARSIAATIEVVGGPRAGKYTLGVPDVGCIMMSARNGRPKKFEANLGIPETDPSSKDPKALTILTISIRNASGAGPVGGADYLAQITFGPFGDARHEVFYMSGFNSTTGRKGGSGTVQLKDSGKDAQVLLDLAPQAGVAVKGTVTCTNVLRY